MEPLHPQLLLARAAALARGGDFASAEALLCPGGVYPADPAALDMLARIRAQQADYCRAEQLWRGILKADATNPDAHAGLARIAQLRKQQIVPAWQKLLTFSTFLLGTLLVAIAIIRGMQWNSHRMDAISAAVEQGRNESSHRMAAISAAVEQGRNESSTRLEALRAELLASTDARKLELEGNRALATSAALVAANEGKAQWDKLHVSFTALNASFLAVAKQLEAAEKMNAELSELPSQLQQIQKALEALKPPPAPAPPEPPPTQEEKQ